MRLSSLTLLTILIFLSFTASAWAVVTPAGTPIINKATATYKVGTSPLLSKDSNTLTIMVAELINVSIVSQDGGNLSVAPGSTNALKFLVANTGNGTETFTFAVNNGVGGDDFDPTLVAIYADTDGTPGYSVTDTLISSGGPLPSLASGATINVFVVSTIPDTPLDGNQGITAITLTSTTGSGAKGTVFLGAGDGVGVDAVIGAASLPLNSTATYTITSISVVILKGFVVSNPENLVYDNKPVPGATITYSLAVTVNGTGTATALTITDPIPTFTTYKPTTLKLESGTLSDGTGDDAGEATGAPVNLITVRLGDMAAGTKTITFDVTIN